MTLESEEVVDELVKKARFEWDSKPRSSAIIDSTEDNANASSASRPNVFVQMALLTHRSFVNLWRNPVLLRSE